MKILLVILSLLVLTGCKKEEVKEVIPEQPKKNIKELVNIKEVKISNNKMIFIITNNNNFYIDINLNYTFYASSNEDKFNRSREIESIRPNSTQIVKVNRPDYYKDMYIIYEVYESSNIDNKKYRYTLESKRINNDLIIKLKNRNNDNNIYSINVLLFKNGKVIDYINENIRIRSFQLESIKITPNTNINYDDYDIFIK